MEIAVKIKNIIFITIFTFSLLSLAHAESDVKEGYDENTEITVKGTVTEMIQRKRDPVILRLKAENKTYNIVTAPQWYLKQEGVNFQMGSGLEITGSKYFGRDGSLYIISKSIKDTSSEKSIILRDSYCRPLWREPLRKGQRMPDKRMP